MTASIYQANLDVLSRTIPGLARQLREVGPIVKGMVTVSPSKSGLPTASVLTPSGGTVQLHSRYDPIGEARNLVGKLDDTNLVTVLGLGLGYALDAIEEQLKGSPLPYNLMVVEPDIEIFRAYVSHRDVRHFFQQPGVYWFIGTDPVTFGNQWNRLLDWGRLDGFRIVEHPPSLALHPEYYAEIKAKLLYIARRSKGNLITIIGTVRDSERNCLRNLPYFVANPGIHRLFGKFAGVPTVVVAAGPSLEYVIPELKQIKGRFPIIAVDTAFRQLVERGVRPDVVVAADTSYLNTLDFIGVENETEVILAVECMVNPRIFKAFRGPKLIMDFGGNMTGWATVHTEEKGIIDCWGSISTTAFDLAVKMGADPIIMVGLDLSFEDGLLHARGSYSDDVHFNVVTPFSSLEHEISSYINTWGVVKLTGKRGQTIYTDGQMNIYRQWFQDRFKSLSQQVVNCTVGGVKLDNTTDIPFADAIERFGAKGIDVASALSTALSAESPINVATLREHLRIMLRDLSGMEEISRRNLELFKQLDKVVRPEMNIDDVTGLLRTNWIQMTKDIDRVSANSVLYGWLSNHALKVITRYNFEVLKLMKANDNNLQKHLTVNRDFFRAVHEYTQVFLPLIRENIKAFEASPAGLRSTYR